MPTTTTKTDEKTQAVQLKAGRSDLTKVYEPKSFEQAIKLARWLASSSLTPTQLRNKERDLIYVMIAGAPYGLTPVESMRAFFAVPGKNGLQLGMYAQFMIALALQHPECEDLYPEVETDKKAVWVAKRKGKQPIKGEYTLEDAKRAGLTGKDNWKNYAKDMLSWRAAGRAIRKRFPDVFFGQATVEELEDTTAIVLEDAGEDAITVEAAQIPPAAGGATEEQIQAIARAMMTSTTVHQQITGQMKKWEVDTLEELTQEQAQSLFEPPSQPGPVYLIQAGRDGDYEIVRKIEGLNRLEHEEETFVNGAINHALEADDPELEWLLEYRNTETGEVREVWRQASYAFRLRLEAAAAKIKACKQIVASALEELDLPSVHALSEEQASPLVDAVDAVAQGQKKAD